VEAAHDEGAHGAPQGPEHERPQDGVQDGAAVAGEPKAPHHGTRGLAPGPRGCWAVKANGEACGASKMRQADYCSAHMGLGVSQDPAAWSGIGGAAASRKAAQRAELRLALGVSRRSSPRQALKAATAQRAGELAWRAVDAALDPKVEATKAADLALRLFDAVDPLSTLTVSAALPDSVDALQGMSFSGLQSLALAQGLVD